VTTITQQGSPPHEAQATVVTKSHIGHAIAVGAAGFAWCSLALGLTTIGAISTAGGSIILPGTFFYGGIVQLLAGFFALAAGATFAAAFMCAYGAFWLGYTAITVYSAPHIAASVIGTASGPAAAKLGGTAGHDITQALGLFLAAWLVVTLIFTVASLGTNAVTLTAFVLLNLVIVFLLIAYLGASSVGVPKTGALHTAGWFEILLAAAAFYLVLAELANETFGRKVFPLFHFNRSAHA
jgi:hypothetical protein